MEHESQSSFLGTGWSFPPAFSKGKKGVEMTSNEEDINRSLEILLSTGLGERVMQPDYGCDLTKLLYEPLDTTLETYVKDLINTAILYHEPRIKLEAATLELDQEREGVIRINLDYTVKTTNSRHNYVYPFYLEEGTNIKK